jgi:hypothetical protein
MNLVAKKVNKQKGKSKKLKLRVSQESIICFQ